MLDRLEPLLRNRGREHHIALEFLKPAVDFHFPGDPELLEQVLLNLAYNAIDATSDQPAGKVVFSAQRAADQRLLFTVADNGTGIDEELLGKIFVPFFTTKKEGSGIGLSVSRQIIRMHGGRLRVRSRKAEGTIMEVELGLL
jgi:signal transduction histidine kinase